MTLADISNLRQNADQEGLFYWNRQKELGRLNKIQEQREVRDMMNSYWPWGIECIKPRGLRNLRLEGIFPNNDFVKAKRLVSPLGLGRPGGGAPMVTYSGRKLIRTVEDPLLRFQWNKDLRKEVDNSLRYKTDKFQCEEYKRQLDKQIAERKLKERKEKKDDLIFHQRSFLRSPPWGKPGPGGTNWRPPGNIGINFLKSLGWSTENTLKRLEKEREHYKHNVERKLQNFNHVIIHSPTKIKPPEFEIKSSNREIEIKPYNKLPPLNRGKVNGEELVPLLAKERMMPLKIPLASTDVTRGNPEMWGEKYSKYAEKRHISSRRRIPTPTYLRDLTRQIDYKKRYIQEMKARDTEMVRRHFNTLDNFWGRPGHGAPRSIIKKGSLNRLLYNQSIRVH